jgi:UDP-N-acetylmuramate dehydrogenase
LASLTTFGIGGTADYFYRATDETDVWEFVRWAEEEGNVPIFVLGGGSNLLVSDEGFRGLVLQMAVLGIEERNGIFDVGAGEVWDEFVTFAVNSGCAGVECLAGIPGSVGGTPVQNVGAYGQEVSETIESVRALDRRTGFFTELSKAECRFRYRESLFNTDEPGRYVVTRVRFRLRAGGAPELKYADLRKKFAEGAEPTLAEVAAAVREIRRSKGMLLVDGDADCRSAGSFFKNPIVAEEMVEQIAAAAGVAVGDVPHWPAGEGKVKVPAAWLLERAGFVKGYGVGPVGISTRHTLALTNRGGATFADVQRLQEEIVGAVRAKFGVDLVREPVVLG